MCAKLFSHSSCTPEWSHNGLTLEMSLMTSWYLCFELARPACSRVLRFLRIFLFFCSRGSWRSSSMAWLLFNPSGVWESCTTWRSTSLACSASYNTRERGLRLIVWTSSESVGRLASIQSWSWGKGLLYLCSRGGSFQDISECLTWLNFHHIHYQFLCSAKWQANKDEDALIRVSQHVLRFLIW